MTGYALRRDRLTQSAAKLGVDGFFITNPVNVSYLTGFSGEASYLLLGPELTLLVSDGRFVTQLEEECPGLPCFIRPPSMTLPMAAGQELGKTGWSKVAVESGHLTIGEFDAYRTLLPSMDWLPRSDSVEKLRMIKDAEEIQATREAIRMAQDALKAFLACLGTEDTEKELHDRMELLLRQEGAKGSAFPTIVGAGKRAALPHAPPTAARVDQEEVLLIDWGADGGFYKSDLTRTFAPHKISAKFAEVYMAVLDAQQRAIAMIRPGVQGQAVYAEARRALEEAGLASFFTHGLGHGIGMNVHEMPFLRPGQETPLEAGMIITIEPGVYLPEWGGIRIEDDVLVTPEGHEVMTKDVPKELEQALLTW